MPEHAGELRPVVFPYTPIGQKTAGDAPPTQYKPTEQSSQEPPVPTQPTPIDVGDAKPGEQAQAERMGVIVGVNVGERKVVGLTDGVTVNDAELDDVI